ncbi:McrB family protein [Pseudomonas sp. Marseille-P9899]|uniref:McrB family protein n=1 Tax=Pseudomonas sp. Marseille-P9899 TaxID=2730401 RepID=UPI00158B4FAA|nr:AAA family ATPase [Pseudomonas sp. Marseille-P9899]
MNAYFNREQFTALQSCANQRREAGNPLHENAWPQLKAAYEVTASWAQALQRQLFPEGHVKVRRAPLNQAQFFHAYNWARIYPAADSPVELAYTVGIDSELGFIVKIDTVFPDAALQRRFEQQVGNDHASSPVAAMLTMEEGLAKDFDELVAWSVDAIQQFRLDYPSLVRTLELRRPLTDDEVLARFDKRPEFAAFRRKYWSSADAALFCRLARAVHLAGLDWWHANKTGVLRFGRKQPGTGRAIGLLGVVRGQQALRVSWIKPVDGMDTFRRARFDDPRMAELEEALENRNENGLSALWPTNREGYWPDQLLIDDASGDQQDEDEEMEKDGEVMKPINRIYYGPPGTGKTWTLLQLLKSDYEDGAEVVEAQEWQQQVIAEQVASLTWWEAIAWALHDLGNEASITDIRKHKIIQALEQAKSNQSVYQTIRNMLFCHAVGNLPLAPSQRRLAPLVFEKASEGTWTLTSDWKESCTELLSLMDKAHQPPAAGEKVRRYSMVTFHQSYGYEEFVEGLRPVLDDTEAESIRYEIRPGVFKELCRRARETPDKRFAMVIDEINRGNISKIFGELITLIEADKREGAEHAVSVALPHSPLPFSIPANVDIIGSMNTADRSLALLDTALRRRFEFVAVMPDARDEVGAPLAGLRVNVHGQQIDVPKLLSVINQRIRVLYDDDHCIGHAYFVSLAKVPDGQERLTALANIFQHRILPLLEEYFFEDRHKVQLVLGDQRKKTPAHRFLVESPESDWALLFGTGQERDSYGQGQFYELQLSALLEPQAYITTYQPR